MGIGLARKGYRVLLVDLDPQGNLSMSLGVSFPDEAQYAISDILLYILQNERTIDDYTPYINQAHGVDFFIGNDDLQKLDKMMQPFRDSEYTLVQMLEPLREQYDYIIIDCMPSIGSLTENAIIVADEIIIPSEPQFFSTKGIQTLFKEVSSIKRKKNPSLKIAGILPTKVDFRTSIAREFTDAIAEIFDRDTRIFSAIPTSTKISECNDGKCIFDYDKNGKGVAAYLTFLDEYLGG